MSADIGKFIADLVETENPEIRRLLVLITALCDEQNRLRPLLRNLERDVAKLREAYADPAQLSIGSLGPYSAATVAMRLVKETIENCGGIHFHMGDKYEVQALAGGQWHSGFGATLVTAVGDLYGNCAKAGLKVKGVTPSANPTMSA